MICENCKRNSNSGIVYKKHIFCSSNCRDKYFNPKEKSKINLKEFSKTELELAEILHNFYLEATKNLDKENYNPNAIKPFSKLSIEQKYIDCFIAHKLLKKVLNIKIKGND